MNRSQQLAVNLIASGVAFTINLGISFFLTPYIVRSVGVEAYGFVSLGTNFISYASLLTIALNSMASRFITIEIHRDNWDKVNVYFNSVLMANVLVGTLVAALSVLVVYQIDRIVIVPASIIQDVRVLFSFLFVNFIISITLASYGVVTFALNKLYLKSMRSIESNLIRVVSVVLLFRYFPPKISFLGFTAFIALMYVEFFNIYYTSRFLPKVRLSRSFFDRSAVLELMSSGVWNTVIRLGNLLLSGMDLIIANRLIGPSAMGILALAKMVPNHITTMVVTISAVFTPEFTIYYAQGRKKELVVALKRSMKILGIIANMPIAILVAYGYQFFSLWVPGQDARLLQILSVITVGAMVISGPINSIYGIFTVTNRLRVNALLLVFSGLLNIGVVIFLVQTTTWGIFAVAGVSTVLNLLRNLLFTAPFGARYLDLPWNTFFPEIARGILAFLVVIVIGLGMEQLIPGTNWFGLVLSVAATAGLGLVANAFLMLTRNERDYLVRKIVSSVSSRAFRSKS